MTNELSILNRLKTVIQTQLNSYLPEGFDQIGERNVIIDIPDTDQMPMKTMLYIIPNWADYEALTTENDACTFNIAVFIVCHKDSHSSLTTKIHTYFDALQSLIHANTSLDGEVDFSTVDNVELYYLVDGTKNVQAAEASLSVRYTKDYF